MSNKYCIIMAGGIGSRFWPLSKDNCPKQFLDILGTGKSFIRSTFERFLPVVPPSNFLVVTNAAYKKMVLEHLPELREDQVLCEPMRRNTAPCIAYASFRIASQCPDAVVAVSPADHLVLNEIEFQKIINTGFDFVSQTDNSDALMTIGIKPTRPETGYGYIELPKEPLSLGKVTKVENFKEKPDLAKAESFVKAGNYLWNSGIFIWSLKGIMTALQRFLPDMVTLFEKGREHYGKPSEQSFINAIFPECQNISIDYGVMEHAEKRYTIPAEFGWSDIGTWGSLFTHVAKDECNNARRGKTVVVDTCNSIVNVEDGVEAIVEGLDGYLVAFRDKSLLVCRLADEQNIKNWVEKL